MVYTQPHLYVTFHWQVQGGIGEEGQTGIRIDHDGDGTAAVQEDTADAFSTFWANAASSIPSFYQLYMVKFARIGVDGRYPPDSEADIFEYPSMFNGGGTSVRQFPLQISSVASLTTAAVRGRAHRGRLYLPPLGQNLDGTDRWQTTFTAQRVTTLKTCLDTINTLWGSVSPDPGGVSVMSKVGAGTTRRVTGIAIGTRPDVQRRRANQLPEVYSTGVLA